MSHCQRAKGLPAGWHQSDSGRRGSGLWRGRGELGWAGATPYLPLPAGMGDPPGGPGAPASPFSPFCPGNWWKPVESSREMPSQYCSIPAPALMEGVPSHPPWPCQVSLNHTEEARRETPPYQGSPAVQDGWSRRRPVGMQRKQLQRWQHPWGTLPRCDADGSPMCQPWPGCHLSVPCPLQPSKGHWGDPVTSPQLPPSQ